MIPRLPFVCRSLLWIAERLVPAARRDDWRREWQGELWHWMSRSADPTSGSALLQHASGAVRDGFHLRFDDEEWHDRWAAVRSGPWTPLGLCAALLIVIAIASGGFEKSRRLGSIAGFREPERLMILSQQGILMGQRLGLREIDVVRIRLQSQTIQSAASYIWYTAAFGPTGASREVPAAMVSRNFFTTLGLNINFPIEGDAPFIVSHEFWKRALRGDRTAIGRMFVIGGRPLKLAAILPPGFSLMSEAPAIFTLPVPSVSWPEYLAPQYGSIARVRPGVASEQVSADIQKILGFRKPWARFEAVPLLGLTQQAARAYAVAYAVVLLIAGAMTAIVYRRTRKQHVRRLRSARQSAFFAGKAILLLTAVFAVVFEFTGATRLGPAGNTLWTSGAVSAWTFLFGSAVALRWAWTDQKMRCPQCMRRLSLPIRIGVPGQMLLNQTGVELMCPRGHGTVYATESVLGWQVSDRWMNLDPFGDDGLTLTT